MHSALEWETCVLSGQDSHTCTAVLVGIRRKLRATAQRPDNCKTHSGYLAPSIRLPMALSHYEQRRQLVTDEANAIAMVEQRAQPLPEPFRSNILQLVREYVDARIDFAKGALNGHAVLAAIDHAKHLQNEMLQQTVMLVQQNPNVVTPIFAQALGGLGDLTEQRLAAAEKRIPGAIWLVLILISVLTCFVVGYSMRRRMLLAMIVVPLTVAIVLALVSELDSPRSGFMHAEQLSMERLQMDLRMETTRR